MNKRRTVITGLGVISPLGNTVPAFYQGLRNNCSSIREMSEWEIGTFHDKRFFGSPVSVNDADIKAIPRPYRRSMAPVAIYSVLAAQQAIKDAGLTEISNSGTGCIIGSTMGGTSAISEAYRIVTFGKGVEEMSSMQFFKSVSHTAAFNVAHFLNIQGMVLAPCAACASALQSIGTAYDLISMGRQDVIICGGAEELALEVSGSFEIIYAGLASGKRDSSTCSRPFDADRCGLVCGEGSGILVIEELEHALRRNATIYGEIAGYATCCCGTQISQSDSTAMKRCLQSAFDDAQITPEQVDYINAHATSTIQGDAAEAAAIRELLGKKCPVSSLKGHIGHTLGASGSLELIASLMMMQNSEIIPTRNLETPGNDCAGLDYVIKYPRKKEIDFFVKNSFAFGGINAALICRKYTKN